MDRWLWVSKDVICWKKLSEMDADDELELCTNKAFKKKDKIIVYRSGNHRDLAYILEVKKDSKSLYGKYKTILTDKVEIKNPITLSDLRKSPEIKKWKTKFLKEFHKIPFTQWNIIIELISENNPGLFKKHKPKCCSGPDPDGYPLNYKEPFFKLIDKIREYKNKESFNEETTKQLIIIPILQKMGWNTYDVCEVHPEHGVHHRTRRVDYILNDHKSRQVCIEAKRVGETDFNFHEGQLLEYCAYKHVDIGILTNGLIWRFYRINYHSKDLEAIKNVSQVELNLETTNKKKIMDTFIQYLWKGNVTDKKRDKIDIPSLDTILDNINSMTAADSNKFNEEAMKQGIVIPLLNNLGWDTLDPSMIVFEKSIKVGKKKKKEKIDFILGKYPNELVVEVKGIGDDLLDIKTLNNHEEHFLDYMDAGKHNYGILTNGKVWKFYLNNEGFWKIGKIVIDKNVNKDDFATLISKENVANGMILPYFEELL
ncbi:MAG: hypothetical protein HPY60_10720 [Candidatus Methanofastidiosum sp.]|nr:hypothetical protein [Methanofastidiosum sp.]